MSKVIYILSKSHSGSTLLDYVVGSIPGAFSTGEVTYLPWQIQRGRGNPPTVTKEQALDTQDVCTCLKSFQECELWSRVIERLSEKVGFDIYKDPLRFKIAVLEHDAHWASRQPDFWRDNFLVRLPRIATILGSTHRCMAPVVDLIRAGIRRELRNN